MQCFFAVVCVCLLYFMPESPRWLCYMDRHAEAQVVMARLQSKPADDASVRAEITLIMETIANEKQEDSVGWREVFSGGEQQNLRRILLGAGTSLMQQLGGINVVVYYLPVILMKSFGFSNRFAALQHPSNTLSQPLLRIGSTQYSSLPFFRASAIVPIHAISASTGLPDWTKQIARLLMVFRFAS